MAFYLIRTRLRPDRLPDLRAHLAAGAWADLRPFGRSLTRALEGARLDPATGEAVWEEEDYCSPPLRMEREAVLDRYCGPLEVEPVREGEGWSRIAHLPPLWDPPLGTSSGRASGGRARARGAAPPEDRS